MINLKCNSCGQILRIPEQYAGQQGKCNGCGADILVPRKKESKLSGTHKVIGLIVIACLITTISLITDEQDYSSPSPSRQIPGDSEAQATAPEAFEPALTEAHINAALDALRAKDSLLPDSIELSDTGYVAITYNMSTGFSVGAESFATETLLIVRNAIYVMPDADKEWNYRLTIFGPSPGPGLVSVIGTARFASDGFDGIKWTPGGL